MDKIVVKKAAAVLLLPLVLSGCNGAGGSMLHREPAQMSEETQVEGAAGKKFEEEESDEREADAKGTEAEEETLSLEEMDFIKYNYYVELNNDLVSTLANIDYYFQVVEDQEEFSLLPDSGLTYGYRIYGLNSDIVDDCLYLAEEEPAYSQLDELVQEMAEPLRTLMDVFSSISGSHDYADNQYQKAKEYHQVIYETVGSFTPLAYEYMDAIAVMGDEKTAQEEERMKEEGKLIAYNASRGISIGKKVLNVVYDQGVTDENITELDLTEIRVLYEELVAVVSDLDAAASDNNQLIKESLSNSRPFDGLYDSEIQALEWMIRQVESGRPLDLSGSGAPLGSIGHFSETLSKCIERYNTVFVD